MANIHCTKTVAEWIASEQGKHFCQCGCGQEIVIKSHHHCKGIPNVIRGHLGRIDKGGIPVVSTWLKEQSKVKRYCACGCRRRIVVSPKHRYSGIPEYLAGHDPKTKKNLSHGFNGFRNTEEEFWASADEQPNGCWIWRKSNKRGYGSYHYRGRKYIASRLSFYLSRGYWPKKGMACHTCDNPACINPDHLFDGDQMDNMTDAAVKLRMNRKYSPEQIMKIVTLRRSGISKLKVAKQVGVSAPIIDKIMDGSVWSHLTGIPKKCR